LKNSIPPGLSDGGEERVIVRNHNAGILLEALLERFKPALKLIEVRGAGKSFRKNPCRRRIALTTDDG